MCCLLMSRHHKQPHKSALGALGDAQCVRRQWGVCARVCEMWDVAGWLLLLMGGVLCVERCGGVRRACAVRVCVLECACVCVPLLCVRQCGLCDVLCCAPVYCAVWRRLGWQGCAVGCGVLRVVVRLPDGVRRLRSPLDRAVGGPGCEHANARCM